MQVLVTWTERGTTSYAYRGTGNHFTRVGMARHFLDGEANDQVAGAIAGAIRSAGADGDGDD